MSGGASFQSLLSSFLLDYLPRRRGFSQNTIASYRDAFRLLLTWFRDERGIRPESIEVEDIKPEAMGAFTGWLVSVRGCSPATANVRLSAVKSFFRFVMHEAPEHLSACSEALGVRAAKVEHGRVAHLEVAEVAALVAAATDLRERAVVSLLYDSGARVSELCGLDVGDLSLDRPFSVHVLGKGRKHRTIPISDEVGGMMRDYVGTLRRGARPDEPLFVNREGMRLGRAGVAYILRKCARLANEASPGSVRGPANPHCLRHSKAMHLLECDVNLVYIRDFLGHESVTTTEVYARASTKAKRKALERASAEIVPESVYSEDDKSDLLEWLRTMM